MEDGAGDHRAATSGRDSGSTAKARSGRRALVMLAVVWVVGIPAFNVAQFLAHRPIAGGVTTTGRIVDRYEVATGPDEDDTRESWVSIEYLDRSERLHAVDVKWRWGEVGREVTVRYDPRRPSRAQWVDRPYGWTRWLAMGGLDLTWLVSLVYLVRSVRGRWAQEPGRPSRPGVDIYRYRHMMAPWHERRRPRTRSTPSPSRSGGRS